MPLNTAVVGGTSKSFVHDVDARWLMAYAAGLGDFDPAHTATEARSVLGHPVFPVCLEWPAILDCANIAGAQSASAEERTRGVHAAHDLHIHRPIRAGERLTTQATVVGLEQIKPGAAQTTRLDTYDTDGELVSQTYQLGITRGVEVIGNPAPVAELPELPRLVSPHNADLRFEIPVSAQAAHIYTECARIWNPIHTDRAVALAAGLPDIILHGTATMALAVSKIVEEILQGDSTRVSRLGGRFSAMVLMPSTITLAVHGSSDGVVSYTVFTEDGQAAFSQGFLCYH
jgi:acyl dehydratase